MANETKNPAEKEQKPGRTKLVRITLLVALAVGLAWLVTRHSLVAYLAEVAPQSALALDGRNPAALVNIADGDVNRGFAMQAEESRLAAFAKSAAGPTSEPGVKKDPSSSDADREDPLDPAAWASIGIAGSICPGLNTSGDSAFVGTLPNAWAARIEFARRCALCTAAYSGVRSPASIRP